MDTLTIAFLSVVVIFISIWFLNKMKSRCTLSGPWGLPIIGYMPFLTKKPYAKLKQLSETYGPIYSIRLGSKDVVVLCDFKSIKDAFNTDAFMGRPPALGLAADFSEATMRSGAILDMPWKEHRRFSLHMLRDLGFGKSRMENHIKEEILELIERIQKHDNTRIRTIDFLTPSMSNNIASFIFGKRLKYDDSRRQKLDGHLHEVGRQSGSVSLQVFFPSLAFLLDFFHLGSKRNLLKALKELKEYMREECKEHEETLDKNNIRDFMDGYLLEIQKREKDLYSPFHKDTLEDMARGIFGAGSETVRITVEWMLLLYAALPDVQVRVQRECDETLGRDRFPTWEDRGHMPYTEATILELMRWKDIIPLNILRYTLTDTELHGHFIPKHSYVLAVLYAVHHDETLWGEDCGSYKPERFLTEDGTKVIKPEYFIPFSIGKRQCPGKILAEIEVFLYVVAIVKKFKLSIPPGNKPDLEGTLGIGMQPKPQDIVFEIR